MILPHHARRSVPGPSIPELLLACLLIAHTAAAQGVSPGPAAKAPADPIEGTKWLGTLTAPDGNSTPFGLAFARSPRGTLYALAWVPVMHVFSQPTATVTVRAGDYFLDVLNAHLRIQENRLVGAGLYAPMTFSLARVSEFPPAPDQSPASILPAGPSPRWRRDLGAAAWTTPAVTDGLAYLGTADGHFHAVDGRDGHEVWTWIDPTPIYGSALVAGDAVWFVNARTEVVRLDRRTGKLVWRAALDRALAAAAAIPEDDTYSHRTAVPVLADGTLYVGSTDGGIVALDAAKGTVRWRFELGSKICAAAAIDGNRLLVGSMDGTLIALERRAGTEAWRRKLPGAIVSQPVVFEGLVFVGSRDYLLHALRASDGTEAWRQHFWVSWVESAPRIVDGVLYVGSSDLRAVRALDPLSGKVLWSTDVYGSAWGTPLVARNRVLMGVAGTKPYVIDHRPSIVALDRRTGAILWRRGETQAEAGNSGHAGSLALAGDDVLAAGIDGSLIALPLNDK